MHLSIVIAEKDAFLLSCILRSSPRALSTLVLMSKRSKMFVQVCRSSVSKRSKSKSKRSKMFVQVCRIELCGLLGPGQGQVTRDSSNIECCGARPRTHILSIHFTSSLWFAILLIIGDGVRCQLLWHFTQQSYNMIFRYVSSIKMRLKYIFVIEKHNLGLEKYDDDNTL